MPIHAAELAGESLGVRRDLGDRRGLAATLRTLTNVARDRGDAERAAALAWIIHEQFGLIRLTAFG